MADFSPQTKINLTPQVKTFLLGLSISFLFLVAFFAGAIADRVFVIKPLNFFLSGQKIDLNAGGGGQGLSNLLSGRKPISDIAEAASESVVTVSQRREQTFIQSQGIFGFDQAQEQRVTIKSDIGTGFVVEGGLVVTNKHVVDEKGVSYSVIDKHDQEHLVSRVYLDPEADIAILQIDNSDLPVLSLGDSDQIRVGQDVIAIGTALGKYRHTVTTGVVSGLGRGVDAIGGGGTQIESLEGVIQTDTAINPGNSGGPLLDTAGEVIGVNVAVTQAQNISFALPINLVKNTLEYFNRTGRFDRPVLGVEYRQIPPESAELNQVPVGAYITQVTSGSVADKAGLKVGDIITSWAGQSLVTKDLSVLVNQHQLGDEVEVELWREGEVVKVSIEL